MSTKGLIKNSILDVLLWREECTMKRMQNKLKNGVGFNEKNKSSELILFYFNTISVVEKFEGKLRFNGRYI